MNRYRRIFTRWEKKSRNYEAFLHFVFAIISFKASGVLGSKSIVLILAPDRIGGGKSLVVYNCSPPNNCQKEYNL